MSRSGMPNARLLQFQQYQKNQIMSLSPIQLVIKVYEIALVACKKEDTGKASKAIVELISGLKFEPELQHISVGLFQLYQYVLDKIRENDFDEAIKILSGLKEAWVEASKKEVSLKATL